jgi:hypothetical protein
MTTKDFKEKFNKNPESSYIANYLQHFLLLRKFNGLPEYFRKINNIEDVHDVEELYRIKGQIFLLKSSCSHIVDLLNQLNFHVTEEFDDKLMTLDEIGIKAGDKFKCVKDYLHWDILLIKPESIISIHQFRYAGVDSLFSAKIENLVADNNNQHFPAPEELPLILNFNELSNHFKRM